jgi:Ala-tRNA(Pro) deacylase
MRFSKRPAGTPLTTFFHFYFTTFAIHLCSRQKRYGPNGPDDTCKWHSKSRGLVTTLTHAQTFEEAVMNECLESLRHTLDEEGIWYEVIEHPEAVTAQRVADVEDVPGHTFVKSVVVFVDDKPYLLALPAPHVVDFEALRKDLDASGARLATEDEFSPLFPDCEVGAMPPFAGPNGLPVLMDRDLRDNREIVFEAGSHTESIRMATDDYVKLANPRLLSFAREPAGSEPASKRS